jgi:hypothetical protein
MHYFGSKDQLFARAADLPAERYRAAAEPQLSRITAAIPTADAEIRAGLLSAIVHGVIIERYLLRLGGLATAPPEQIIELLRRGRGSCPILKQTRWGRQRT